MKNRIVLLALGAVIVLALPGCGVGEAKVTESSVPEPQAPLPVEVVLARTSDIFATYETTAVLAADAEAEALARVAGEVVEILVEEGTRVEEGQVLARLDGDRARLEMLQAKANLEMAEREYDRVRRLHEKGLVSASAFETLKFDVDALQAQYELQRLDYNYTAIRATIPGVVAARHIKLGWRVNAGDPLFRIANVTRLAADLSIPQSELGKFAGGLPADIEVDAMPQSNFRATVARISPTIDARTGTFRATVYVDNREGLLAPGMFSRFSISYEKHPDALVIPSDALVREDNENVVYVIEDGAASRRQVTVGIESNGVSEILNGLAKDEQIVVTGQGSLRDGSKVLASQASGGIAG
jgi:RND family efflux transporter MFP subunit